MDLRWQLVSGELWFNGERWLELSVIVGSVIVEVGEVAVGVDGWCRWGLEVASDG